MFRNVRQSLRLRRYRIQRSIKQFHKNPPPNWLQSYSQIISVVLALVAIVLTIYISRQQQDVKDMKNVLKELVKQNVKLDTQIVEQGKQIGKLNELSERSLAMIASLRSVQNLLINQNTTLRINSEPKIQLNGNFYFKKFDDKTYIHSAQVTNVGSRTARDWESWVTVFTYSLTSITYLRDVYCFKTDLNPNTINTISDTLFLNANENFKQIILNIGYRVESRYYDPLTNKPIVRKEYFRHAYDENGELLTLFFDENYKKWIDQLIDSQRKPK